MGAYRLPFSTIPRYTDDVMEVVALWNHMLIRMYLDMSFLIKTYDSQSSGGRALAAEEYVYKSVSCARVNQLSRR